ncbi:hypothetical protein DFJ73DRAFT_894785 [Zopfochytrium polystomum]|nr:hypothetical protein DFJ73DRAFT_894785 [Zopfochytrium polystomum]
MRLSTMLARAASLAPSRTASRTAGALHAAAGRVGGRSNITTGADELSARRRLSIAPALGERSQLPLALSPLASVLPFRSHRRDRAKDGDNGGPRLQPRASAAHWRSKRSFCSLDRPLPRCTTQPAWQSLHLLRLLSASLHRSMHTAQSRHHLQLPGASLLESLRRLIREFASLRQSSRHNKPRLAGAATALWTTYLSFKASTSSSGSETGSGQSSHSWLSRHECRVLLSAILHSTPVDSVALRVNKLLKDMQHHGLPLTPRDLSFLIRAQTRRADYEAGRRAANIIWDSGVLYPPEQPAPFVSQSQRDTAAEDRDRCFGAILELCAAAADARAARSWWRRMLDARLAAAAAAGTTPTSRRLGWWWWRDGDDVRWQLLVEAHVNANEVETAEALLAGRFDALQLCPDVRSLRGERAALIDDALGIDLQPIGGEIKRNRRPSLYAYNAVVKAWSNGLKMDKAVAVYNFMLSQGVKPDVWTFSFLLHGFARLGDIANAKRVYQRLRFLEVRPDAVFYTILISALLTHNDVAGAEAIFSLVRSSGIEEDRIMFNTVVDRHAKAGNLSRASQLLVQRLRSEDSGIGTDSGVAEETRPRPDLLTFTSIIDAYMKVGDDRTALAWWSEMVNGFRLAPDTTAYTAVINGFARTGNMGSASLWFSRLLRDGCRPNLYTYTAMIAGHAFSGNMDAAKDWLNRLRADPHVGKPDAVAMNAIAAGHAAAGDFPAARAALDEMEAAGFPANQLTYRMIIDACVRREHLDAAVAVYKEMHRRGVAPDVHIFTVLLTSLGHEAARVDARALRVGVSGKGGLWSKRRKLMDPPDGGGVGAGVAEQEPRSSVPRRQQRKPHRPGAASKRRYDPMSPYNQAKFWYHDDLVSIYKAFRASLTAAPTAVAATALPSSTAAPGEPTQGSLPPRSGEQQQPAAARAPPPQPPPTQPPPIEVYDAVISHHAHALDVRAVQRVFMHAVVDGRVPDTSLVVRAALAVLRGPHVAPVADDGATQPPPPPLEFGMSADGRTGWGRLQRWVDAVRRDLVRLAGAVTVARWAERPVVGPATTGGGGGGRADWDGDELVDGPWLTLDAPPAPPPPVSTSPGGLAGAPGQPGTGTAAAAAASTRWTTLDDVQRLARTMDDALLCAYPMFAFVPDAAEAAAASAATAATPPPSPSSPRPRSNNAGRGAKAAAVARRFPRFRWRVRERPRRPRAQAVLAVAAAAEPAVPPAPERTPAARVAELRRLLDGDGGRAVVFWRSLHRSGGGGGGGGGKGRGGGGGRGGRGRRVYALTVDLATEDGCRRVWRAAAALLQRFRFAGRRRDATAAAAGASAEVVGAGAGEEEEEEAGAEAGDGRRRLRARLRSGGGDGGAEAARGVVRLHEPPRKAHDGGGVSRLPGAVPSAAAAAADGTAASAAAALAKQKDLAGFVSLLLWRCDAMGFAALRREVVVWLLQRGVVVDDGQLKRWMEWRNRRGTGRLRRPRYNSLVIPKDSHVSIGPPLPRSSVTAGMKKDVAGGGAGAATGALFTSCKREEKGDEARGHRTNGDEKQMQRIAGSM